MHKWCAPSFAPMLPLGGVFIFFFYAFANKKGPYAINGGQRLFSALQSKKRGSVMGSTTAKEKKRAFGSTPHRRGSLVKWPCSMRAVTKATEVCPGAAFYPPFFLLKKHMPIRL
nr:hypothetical protein [Pandoravirus aubagnensis]